MRNPAESSAGFFLACCTRVYRVYNLGMKSKDLISRLKKAGWVLRGVKGSHHVFVHPHKPGHLSVPHPQKDMGVGLVQKLLKQAGLEEGKTT